jgi:hypothetical protein
LKAGVINIALAEAAFWLRPKAFHPFENDIGR